MRNPILHNKPLLVDRRQSYVYAIGVVGSEDSPLKFGYTKILDDRLTAIQIGSPVQLCYLAKDFGGQSHEKAIHRHLKSDRLHGEWFARSPAAMEVVRAMLSGSVSELLGLKSGKNPEMPAFIMLRGREIVEL